MDFNFSGILSKLSELSTGWAVAILFYIRSERVSNKALDKLGDENARLLDLNKDLLNRLGIKPQSSKDAGQTNKRPKGTNVNAHPPHESN